MKTTIGQIKVTDIKENDNGTAEITFDISDSFKEKLIKTLGWSEWSDDKFNVFFLQALINYVEKVENELKQHD